MKRNEIIAYLNEIKPFLNLKKVCEFYNNVNESLQIDYNNLRAVLNETHPTRLSDERVQRFYLFLLTDLFEDYFKISTHKTNKDLNYLIDDIKDGLLLVLEEKKESLNNEI